MTSETASAIELKAEPAPPAPGLIQLMAAEFTVAKQHKQRSWNWEIGAAVLSVAAALIPWPWPAIGLVGVAIAAVAKLRAKLAQSKSKASFRLAERARRYDFQQRALDWPAPAQEVADMMLKFSSVTRELATTKKKDLEEKYYAASGAPSERRLFSNLHESMFSTEKLAGVMAERRKSHLAASIAVAFVVLASAIIFPAAPAALLVKVLTTVMTALVSLDLWGELKAFGRTEQEARTLAGTVLTLFRVNHLELNEGFRLMVDYNCLLMELPLIPDEVRDEHQPGINEAWAKMAESVKMT